MQRFIREKVLYTECNCDTHVSVRRKVCTLSLCSGLIYYINRVFNNDTSVLLAL